MWRKHSRTVLRYWAVSYLIILAIPLATGLIVYTHAISILSGEVRAAHENDLLRTRTVFDGKLNELKEIAIRITMDDRVNSVKSAGYLLDAAGRFTLSRIQQDLKKYALSASMVSEVFIYFRNHDLILSESGIYPAGELEVFNSGRLGWDAAEFQKMIGSVHRGAVHYGGAPERERLIYAQSLPIYGTQKDFQATVFIALDGASLGNLLADRAPGSSRAFVPDGQPPICSSGGEALPVDSGALAPLLSEDGSQEIRVEGQPYIFTCLASQSVAGRYVSFVSKKNFTQKVRSIQYTVWIYVLVSTAAGCIISYHFIRHNYHPIRRILEIFQSEDRGAGAQNEFARIEEYVRELIRSRELGSRELERQRRLVLDHYFTRLLEPGASGENLRKLEECGVRFREDGFLAVLVCPTHVDRLFFEERERPAERAAETISLILRNILEETLGERWDACFINSGPPYTLLLNLPPARDDKKAVRDIYASLRQSLRFIEEHFGFGYELAIGSVCRGGENIWRSRADAQRVLEYRELIPSSGCVSFDEIMEGAGNPLSQAVYVERERRLVNSLRAQDYEESKRQLAAIFDECLIRSRPDMDAARGILSSLVTVVNGLTGGAPGSPVEAKGSAVEIRDQLFQRVDACQNHQIVASREQKEGRNMQLLRYIDSRICDPNLNISDVAAQFQMSPSNLSKLFKKEQGQGFLDYVHLHRIALVKELLATTGLSVRQIAERTGYNNDIALIRTFKKYEGVTPGRYKEGISDQNNGDIHKKAMAKK